MQATEIIEKKTKLVINNRDLENSDGTLGRDYILKSLANSGKFDIEYHTQVTKFRRPNLGSILFVNNKKIFLDLWEYPSPTFTKEVFDENYDLILKLSLFNIGFEEFNLRCNNNNILSDISKDNRNELFNKICPFTFFPSKMMYPFINNEDKVCPLNIESFGFFCGKDWKGRRVMKDKLIKEGIDYIASNQDLIHGKTLNDENYMHRMRTSKFGIVLKGRSSSITDGKNRREFDYMMMKKPILMNYKPYYYNDFEEGKHYIFIDQNTDFKNLESMYNISEMADNAFKWYKENGTPEGITNTFIKILKDKKMI